MIISIGDEEFEVEELLRMNQADAELLEQEIQALAELLVKKRNAVVMLESFSGG
jgi:hypothetical protein